jgi:hypothetical protein
LTQRDCGAMRVVAKRETAAQRERVARQDSWQSDNHPAQVRRHKRGGGATREDKKGTGTAREVTLQQPTAGAREAQ